MTTEVTAPPTTEPRPSPRPRASVDKPTTTLTVPAKPAAVTTANVVTMAGTAVAATGPVGAVVAAVVVGGAGAGYAVYRAVVRRSPKDGVAAGGTGTRTAGGRTGSGLRFPGSGRAGRPGAATGSGRSARGSGSGGRGASGRAPSGRAAGARSGAGSASARQPSRSLLGRLGLGGRGSSGTGGSSGKGKGALGKVGRGLGRSVGALSKGASAPARAGWNAAKRRRAASKAAKQAARAAGKPVPGAWNAMRRFVRRNILGKKEQPKKTDTAKAPENTRATGDKVNRPKRPGVTDQNQRGPAMDPTDYSSNGRSPIMASNGNAAQQGSSPLFQAARQVHATAANHQPQGMLARRLEAYEMPLTLGEIAAGLRLLANTHTSKEPLEPAYAAAVMQIAATVESAAQAAKQLGSAFDALHSTQVRRLLQPKPNEQAWDTAHNRA